MIREILKLTDTNKQMYEALLKIASMPVDDWYGNAEELYAGLIEIQHYAEKIANDCKKVLENIVVKR